MSAQYLRAHVPLSERELLRRNDAAQTKSLVVEPNTMRLDLSTLDQPPSHPPRAITPPAVCVSPVSPNLQSHGYHTFRQDAERGEFGDLIEKSMAVAEAEAELEESHQENEILFGKTAYKSMMKRIDFVTHSQVFDTFYEGSQARRKRSCQEKMLIAEDSRCKSMFDLAMLFINAYSCITSIFYVAFSPPPWGSIQSYFDLFVEACFLVDMVLHFLTTYRDQDTFQEVRSHSKIAKKYLLGYEFWVDLIAIFPFSIILGQDAMASKLLRMLRLPRLIRFIKQSTFKGIVDLCVLYSSRNDKVITRHICLFAIRIFRTLLITILLTYFLGCAWHFICRHMNTDSTDTFIIQYLSPEKSGEAPLSDFQKLVYCCYFVLTTVATTGYGDLAPQSTVERIAAVMVMLAGVGFYSLVIGEFINIIENFDKKLYIIDNGLALHAWLTAMESFTAKRPLPKQLINAIDKHFQFFWRNQRILWLNQNSQLLQALPASLRRKIFTNYLFIDVFQMFRGFLNSDRFEESSFLCDFAKHLLPRHFDPETLLFSQNEDVPEIFLLLSGTVKVGFSVMNQTEFCKKKGKGKVVGAYYIFTSRPSQFLYQCHSEVRVMGISKENIRKVFRTYPNEATVIINQTVASYKKFRQSMMEQKQAAFQRYSKTNQYLGITLTEKANKFQEFTNLEADSQDFELNHARLKNFTQNYEERIQVLKLEAQVAELEDQIKRALMNQKRVSSQRILRIKEEKQ